VPRALHKDDASPSWGRETDGLQIVVDKAVLARRFSLDRFLAS